MPARVFSFICPYNYSSCVFFCSYSFFKYHQVNQGLEGSGAVRIDKCQPTFGQGLHEEDKETKGNKGAMMWV